MDKKRSSLELFRLRKILRELHKKEGRGTELVSLYVPHGKQISEVMNSLRQEYGTATNIKSTTTRKNVLDALVKVQQRLKLFKTVPKNGIVIFVSDAGKYRGFFERNSCDRLIDRFKYLYERPKDFQKEISDSILKIRPIDENEIVLLAITLMNLYNISALPILRKNEIVGFLDKINIIRAVFS